MDNPSLIKDGPESPVSKAYSVTPHDTNEIGAYVPKAIWVGTGGTLVVILLGDSASVTLTNIPNGSLLPIRAKIIKSTGTTASGIVAFY